MSKYIIDMSIPFKIVYLIKDGETGENLIQTDELLELNAIDGAKIIDNSIPSAKLNAIDGEKIVDGSIPISKLIKGGDVVYQISNAPPVSLKLGMPVYWAGTNFLPSNAETDTKIPTAVVTAINEFDYTVQFSGIFIMSNSDWDMITGQTGGLSALENQNKYYLSNLQDGYITTTSPPLSIPVYNCIKNDGNSSTVEIKFGVQYSSPSFDSFSQEKEVFIGDGVENTFTLDKTPYSRNTTMVTVNGTVLQNNAFSISNKDIIIVDPPEDELEIEVTYITQSNFNYANIIRHSELVSTSKTTFILPVTPSTENHVMAWIGGSYQDNANFVLNGNNIIFDTAVNVGTKVQFLIFKEVQFSDFSYIKRKTINIANGSTKTLVDAFGEQVNGRYEFHVASNPLISGTIRLQETNPINVRVETASSSITLVSLTAGKINIYINNDGKLEFENRLGQIITLIIERHI